MVLCMVLPRSKYSILSKIYCKLVNYYYRLQWYPSSVPVYDKPRGFYTDR